MSDQPTYLFGPFSFERGTLYRGREALGLTAREALILRTLLERGTNVVPQRELLETVFGRSAHPASLHNAIARLRSVLDDRLLDSGARQYRYIRTKFGDGFFFGGEVRTVVPTPQESIDEREVGRQYWNRRELAALCEAMTWFDRALKRAPRYADAYAARADGYAIMGSYGWTSARDAVLKAKASAREALRWNGSLAQPHSTLGFLHALFERDWARAEGDFAESLRRNPDDCTTHHWRALQLAATCQPLKALEAIATARELDPLRIVDVHIGAILYWAGLFDVAEQQCMRTVLQHDGFWYAHSMLGLVYERQGRFDDALTSQLAAQARLESSSPMVSAALARAYALCGQRADAERELSQLGASNAPHAGFFHRATAYAALGERDKAFACLTSACRRSDVWVSFLEVDPRIDALRTDTRFARLRDEMSLPSAAHARRTLDRKRLSAVLERLDL